MKYDVVVVGAGPAGATAAKFLSEKGVRVLLLDKSTFPREKPCGGGLPVKILKRYPYIQKNNLIDSYSSEGYLHSPSLKYTTEIKKNEPIIAMVIRKQFDDGLVKLAVDSGTVFQSEKTVKHITTAKEDATVHLHDGTTMKSQLVIGADGMWSSIVQQAGGQYNRTHIGICAFQESPLSVQIMDRYFNEKRSIHIHMNILGVTGYGWVFPKHDHVNIGICEFRHAGDATKKKKNLKETYTNYIKILKDCCILPRNFKIERIQGGVFPTSPVKKTYTNRLLLCGDAGGLVNPLTGDGIYSAMVSGEMAAKVCTTAVETGVSTEQMLSIYQKQWNRDFGNDYKRLFRVSKGWGRDNENLVRLASKDKKFIDIALNAVTSPGTIQKYRLKLLQRGFLIYLKDLLGLL